MAKLKKICPNCRTDKLEIMEDFQGVPYQGCTKCNWFQYGISVKKAPYVRDTHKYKYCNCEDYPCCGHD